MRSDLRAFSGFLFVLLSLPAHASDREVLLGTVHKETVFAVPKPVSEHRMLGPTVTLLRAPLTIDKGTHYSPNRYEFRQLTLVNHPYRWRLVGSKFWGAGSTGVRRGGSEIMRIPLEDLPLFDPVNAKREEQYKVKYPESQRLGDAHELCAEPMAHLCERLPLPPGDPGDYPHGFGVGPDYKVIPLPTPGVFFDAYPVSDDRILLFVLDQDKMRVWSGKVERDKLKTLYWLTDWGGDAREPIETFKSSFKGAFTAFVRGKDYYFVTEYGDVYLSRDPGKAERKVEKVWDGRRQPVHALITDAGSDKVWCFVEPFFTDKQDEERVYFELSAKPDPRPYKLKRIDKPKIDEPLKSVLEYAHVLQDDKRLK
jgi:hypothetical protein